MGQISKGLPSFDTFLMCNESREGEVYVCLEPNDDDIMRVGHYTLTFAETLAPLLPNQKGIAYFNPMFPMKPRGLRIKQHVLVEAKNFIERDIPTVDDAGAVAGGRHETPSGLLGNEFAFSEPIRGDIESNSSKT
jgi:hypothetical protein